MDVERNAARVLQYLFIRRFEYPGYEAVKETVRMQEPALVRALTFLEDHDAILMQQSVGGSPIEIELVQEGMEIVRDDDRFRAIFGEAPNLDAIRARYGLDDDDA